MKKMIGVRTTLALSACAGLAFLAGQDDSAPEALGSGWKSRLQILVGRPAPREAAISAAAPVPTTILDAQSDAGPGSLQLAATTRQVVTQTESAWASPEAAPLTRDSNLAALTDADLDPQVDAFRGVFVAVTGANLRSGPGLDFRRADVIGTGQSLRVTGQTRDREWYRVWHRDRELYISAGTVRPERIDTVRGAIDIDSIQAQLDALETQLKRARFHEVLGSADRLRRELEGAARWTPLTSELVRLELMTATSEVALSRVTDASRTLERALTLDSNLELDPRQSPPKLRRLLARVRDAR